MTRERTAVSPFRVDVRSGTLRVEGGGETPPVHIGAEPRIVGRGAGCHLVLADKKVPSRVP